MSALGDHIRMLAAKKAQEDLPVLPTPEAKPWSPYAPVAWSEDWERIRNLPRRDPTPDIFFAERLTNDLATSTGTMKLRPVQAMALKEMAEVGGLLGPIGVGEGKTILALLAPVVMGARNTVLMVPPALRTQLLERHYPEYVRHWKLPILAGASVSPPSPSPGVIHVVAYSELSSIRGADRLERLQPDLIVCDEAHFLRHSTAARTKRFLRYARKAKRMGKCRFVLLSGTIISRSIRDFAHLAALSLGDGSPLPLHWPTLQEWAGVLDGLDSGFGGEPGVLMHLCAPGESMQAAWSRRLIETPGVVATSSNRLRNSLRMDALTVKVPKVVEEALGRMRSEWVTPAGEEIDCSLSLHSLAQQLASGLFYKRTWPRNEPLDLREEWLESRNEYFKEVRNFLSQYAKAGMDSPKLLALAAARGQWASEHFARWSAVHKLARPATEAVWVSEYLVDDAAAWAKKHKGVVWVSIKAFGEKLAQRLGVPYYGGGTTLFEGERPRFDADHPLILSSDAHGTGTDGLQKVYSTQLVVTPSSSGKEWTQLLGRLHREGQEADEVVCNVYQHVPEARAALTAAVENAKFIQNTFRDPQKLTYADFTFDITKG